MLGNRKSIRLKGYDYSQPGMYFVTVCTNNKTNYFGKITRRDAIYRVLLNQTGKIADKYWNKISEYFPFVELDRYVIMPNHIHGIIVINGNDCRDIIYGVSLSKIIRWFKGRVTYEIRKSGGMFLWQERFYDQIVRNNRSLYAIGKYIADNLVNWDNDRENICVRA